MNPFDEFRQHVTRRHFLSAGSHLLGTAALASLGGERLRRQRQPSADAAARRALTHFAPKAKHVIYLHMVGGPSQMDLFDYKPVMNEWYDKDLPESVRMGQRLTTMTSGQARFPIAPSKFKFAQHGQCGMWISELLPWMAKMVDDMCFIRSMHTEAINHEPAITLHADRQSDHRPAVPRRVGVVRPRLAERQPADVRRAGRQADEHRTGAGDLGPAVVSPAICPASMPASASARRAIRSCTSTIRRACRATFAAQTLDGLNALNELNYQQVGDPETHTRIQQYELAFRMQSSVPELTDLASEPEATFKLYGDAAKKPGTFANTALLARRMVERGVRFVQIYHNNWDTHANVAGRLPDQCRDVDQPCYGLIQDLKQRGMFDDTLVIWGGEFGRTIYSQGGLSQRELRPRPSPALLHDVDGRRRLQGRHDLRRDRRLLLQHRQRPGPHPRLPRHGAAPLGFDHERFSVQAPRSRSEAHRRAAPRVVHEILS